VYETIKTNSKSYNIAKEINYNFFSGFPDPLDLATGIEKKEMLLRLAGNDVSFLNI